MASATGIPQHAPIDPDNEGQEDLEPLLGRPGDASQRENAPIAKNLIIGTGVIAEAAGILLVASVWAAVFLNGPLILFSVHPLAQSAGLLVLIQSILVLQPTHTGAQKQVGQKIHAGLNFLAFAIFAVGVISIEVNKFINNGAHFHSVHGYLGVIASFWLLAQYIVGFTMFGLPQLYGGEANAKKMWKYHRSSGYVLLLFLAATVVSATQTDYNIGVLKLKLWAMIVISVLLVIGVFPRIKKHKLGL
ncbi:eukaryotic cytochrome b561-domain-containing protein [Hypoxylon fragiforme]|uniref:eukaryotic cytochrome b561-domain-containing protein n=1 Tax=Hypoxylon fragiforme TaxID=63214 RepID=UPI0020C65BE7|nr:eukaryotic cytochrome b561-domain-containing protein [Hypoxylon fragiforme]KAI2610932.1 eukaryotic cytochrome b561-domain-containing protein [Hypoxylon fragiforme]